MHWTDVAALSVFAGAGCVAALVSLQRSLDRAVAERQDSTDRQLDALATTLKALQGRVTELNRLVAARDQQSEPVSAAPEGADRSRLDDPEQPEMLAVITAAATTFLGRAARIRSARLVPAPQDSVSPWTQQGRTIVQTSHNLRTRE